VLLLELPRLKTLWKKTCTQNYFCSDPQCYYYQVADERVHALIGYGSHGKYEHIPDLFCQLCESKFTIRKYTLLYRLKTHSRMIFMVMTLLVLGIDISALQEAMGIQESTLRTWLTRNGVQARKLHQRFFKDLTMGHIQLDELWAKVKQAQGDAQHHESGYGQSARQRPRSFQ